MLPCHDPVLRAYMHTQVSLIRKSEAKRRKAAALRREEERVLRAEQALKRSAEREAERKERIAGEICTACRMHKRKFICSLALIQFHSSSITPSSPPQPTRPARRRRRWRALKSSRGRRLRRPRRPPCGATWHRRRRWRTRRCRNCKRSSWPGRHSNSISKPVLVYADAIIAMVTTVLLFILKLVLGQLDGYSSSQGTDASHAGRICAFCKAFPAACSLYRSPTSSLRLGSPGSLLLRQ